MPKVFDPDKANKAAEDTIVAAERVKAGLLEKVPAADAKVKKATDAQAKAAATKQSAVDTATKQRATLQIKIEEQEALIARQRDYLSRNAPAQVVEPVGVESGEAVGQF